MDQFVNEFYVSTILGGLTVALGIIMLAQDHRTRGNVGIEMFRIFVGLAVITAPPTAGQVDPDHVSLSERLQVGFETVGMFGVVIYIAHLLATSRSSARAQAAVRSLLVVATAGVMIYGALGFVFPDRRLNGYIQVFGRDGGALATADFWLFLTPVLVLGTAFTAAWLVLARQELDPGERNRAVAYGASVPFIVLASVAEYRLSNALFAVALVLAMYAVIRHLFVQGERAAFLSRFLSPQVAQQVRVDGLTTVMQPGEVVLTVVACDLRGFTAYAEGVPSQAVIDLLSEYYQTVGVAVAEVAGTIKDYAGDGILVLLGAPLPHPEHAADGLRLARRIHEVTRPVLNRWATDPHPLGIGVGVATGRVTVGAIGSDARMEYTAVGTPVNLAARLCSAAADGEILLDERTATALDVECDRRDDLTLKGISGLVPVFAYTDGAAGAQSPGIASR